MRDGLKRKRLARGFTQYGISQAIGIGRTYYTELENGNRKGSLNVWLSIGSVLNIPENELIEYMKDYRRQKGEEG